MRTAGTTEREGKRKRALEKEGERGEERWGGEKKRAYRRRDRHRIDPEIRNFANSGSHSNFPAGKSYC